MFRSLHMAILAIVCILAPFVAYAANTDKPLTWEQPAGTNMPLSQLDTAYLPPLDLERIAMEDALRQIDGLPHRFAIPDETAVDIRSHGTWQEIGDHSVWRYRVQADNAASLNFGFTHYRLPPSARLYIYDAQRQQLAGPWDARKNQPHGQLWTPIIASSDVVIELDVDTAERGQIELLLGRINQGYRGLGGHSKGYAQPDLGQPKFNPAGCSDDEINSGSCNMDVACLAEDDPWNDPRRAVGAITLGGSDDCTGSLVNNTAGDRRRLFATASHCGLTASTAATVVVYWNYEWPTCRTPGTSASGQSGPPDPAMASSGTTFVAATPNPFSGSSCASGMGPTCSDWTLVEIDDPFDPEWNLYWEGWDRRSIGAACSQSSDPTSTVGLCASIHHPNVDEKRITFVRDSLTVSGISYGTGTHWHAAWDPTPPILPNIVNPPPSLPPGVTEPGSSGSPLYTSEQRVVGVLSGGNSYCGATGSDLNDEYGQLAVAWEGRGTPTTRMKDHLDPLNTGAQFIDGMGMSPFMLALDPSDLGICIATDDSAQVEVEVTADPGFAAPVTLAATGLPPGLTASFSPNGVIPPAVSTLTLDGFTAMLPGPLTIGISGSSGADSTSRTLSMSLNDAAPATTQLQLPADGATGISPTPTLTWSVADGGPADYLVEIATDAAFTNIVFSRTVSDDTTLTVTPSLAPETAHYWRVRASNACGDGSVSSVRQFTTGRTFPEPYCPVTFPSAVEPITRVQISAIDHRSSATVNGSPAHEDFLDIPGGTIEPGETYNLLVEGNTAGNYTTRITAYIDWNRNGSFDADENYSIGTISNSTGEDGQNASANIVVPPDLEPGPVRLRVIKRYDTEAPACNNSGYGQAEDYTLTVPSVQASYVVGGTVTGLQGGDRVTLALNADQASPFANGVFTFRHLLPDGSGYTVTDESNRDQLCLISHGDGTVNGADVTDILVDCSSLYDDDVIFRDGFEETSP